MSEFLPLMIDLHEKEIVIFRGRRGGRTQSVPFCEHAKVKVVSREFTSGLARFHKEGKIELIKVKDIGENEIVSFLK